jgi:hypothetical protein
MSSEMTVEDAEGVAFALEHVLAEGERMGGFSPADREQGARYPAAEAGPDAG